MTKIEVLTFEYEHCAECSNVDESTRKGKWKCLLQRKIVPELWGDIPGWCPLPDKVKE